MKNLHLTCRVISGVEVLKRKDESAREDVRFGDRFLALLRFGRNKIGILKIMTNQ